MGYNAMTHGKLIVSDFMSGTVVCTAGQYNLIGKYVVKAGEVIFLGYGDASAMHDAVGRIYALIQKAGPTEMKGTWMLQLESAQDIPLQVLGTWRTEDWNTSSTDKTKQLPWPKLQPGVSKDKKIALYFKPDATGTADNTLTTISLDITRVLV